MPFDPMDLAKHMANYMNHCQTLGMTFEATESDIRFFLQKNDSLRELIGRIEQDAKGKWIVEPPREKECRACKDPDYYKFCVLCISGEHKRNVHHECKIELETD